MAKQPETKFKEKVQQELKVLAENWPIFFDKIQQLSKRGTLDFYICAGGVFVGWELKVGKNRLDALQRYSRTKIKLALGLVREVRPDNLEECLAELVQVAKSGEKFIEQVRWSK